MEVFDHDLWNYLNAPDEEDEATNPNMAERVYWGRVFSKEMVSNCCGATMTEDQALNERCPVCKENCSIKLI